MKTGQKRAATAAPEADAAPLFRVVKPSPEAVPGLAGLDFGGISQTTSKAKSNGANGITLSDDTRALLDQFGAFEPEFIEMKRKREALTKQIAPAEKRDFWQSFAGRGLPEKSPKITAANGQDILLVLSSKYTTTQTNPALIAQAIGAELAGAQFRMAVDVKIEVGEMPESVQQSFVNDLIALARKHEVTSALSVKQYVKPRAGFHEARTTLLTPEQNESLDAVLAVTAFPKLS